MSEKPQGKWRCRVCKTVWDGSQLYQDPARTATVWTCGNLFCGAICDQVPDHPASIVKTSTHQAPRIDGYIHTQNSSGLTEADVLADVAEGRRAHALIKPFSPDDRIKWAIYFPVEMVDLHFIERIEEEPEKVLIEPETLLPRKRGFS